MNKLHEMIKFATMAHYGQNRKESQLPYIIHPIQVMTLYSKFSKDEDELCVALAHDCCEDCDISFKQIEDEFGLKVAEGVAWLTQTEKMDGINREGRKQLDNLMFKYAPNYIKQIKFIDRYCNLNDTKSEDYFWLVKYKKESYHLFKVLIGCFSENSWPHKFMVDFITEYEKG